jgi:hypothetical protein
MWKQQRRGNWLAAVITLVWWFSLHPLVSAQTSVRESFFDSPAQISRSPSDAAQGMANSNVPPEVFQAIYPHRQPAVQEIPNHFESKPQFTPLQLGSREPDRPSAAESRFNDSLMDSMNLGQSSQDRTLQLAEGSARQTNPLPSPSTSQLLSREDTDTPQRGESQGYEIAPASHIEPAPTDLHRQLNLEPTQSRPSSAFDDSTNRRLDSGSIEPPQSFSQPNTSRRTDYQGPTLAELLADSDRGRRSTDGGQAAWDASRAPERDLPTQEAGKTNSLQPMPTENLAETLRRISIGLCIVLGSACGFLLIVKRWYRAARSSSSPSPVKPGKNGTKQLAGTASIQLLTQLRLDHKSQLYLIQANEQQVLVAVDLSGIKSVVPLHGDFNSALENSDSDQVPMRSSASTVDDQDREDDPGIYSPATFQMNHHARTRTNSLRESLSSFPKSSVQTDDVELEMKKKLAELLRGTLVNKQI